MYFRFFGLADHARGAVIARAAIATRQTSKRFVIFMRSIKPETRLRLGRVYRSESNPER